MEALENLWKETDSCKTCSSNLQHVLGAGARKGLMIVFINPTARNMSSNPSWRGPRFPFIGRKRPWDIFEKIGWIDKSLLEEINKKENKWTYQFAEKVESYLKKRELYLTNIIKCTGKDATLPKISEIKSQLHIFEKEVELVDPKIIVSFGSLTTKAILKRDIKMSDLYKKPEFFDVEIKKKKYKVFPCLYPIGRGNPKQAIEMLAYLNSSFKI